MDIDFGDNYQLFVEASRWMGTPYKLGGNDLSGVDCSGLTKKIYARVFDIELSRRSIDQLNKDCHKYPTHSQLQQGDLVFFSSPSSNGLCTHVGVYLKQNKFIHASTSRGVMVSQLDNPYWGKYWIVGGRVR